MTQKGSIRSIGMLVVVAAFGVAACAPSPEVIDAQPAPPGGMVVMSDAEVADLFTTANRGEIEQARLALTNATNQRVRQFAERMIEDHTMVNERAAATLATAAPSTTTTSAASRLQANARESMAALRTYEGAAFDRAYMETQINMHEYVLRTLDQTLIPAARDRDLEALLRDTRPVITEHLRIAREILGALPR